MSYDEKQSKRLVKTWCKKSEIAGSQKTVSKKSILSEKTVIESITFSESRVR